jgi:hypothetical protein
MLELPESIFKHSIALAVTLISILPNPKRFNFQMIGFTKQ